MNPPPSLPRECSQETARRLYNQLEFYRAFMPSIIGMSQSAYAETQEAKNADVALHAYRQETGAEPAPMPS